MKKEFKTVKQVIAHLTNVKKRMAKIKEKNPDLSFSTYVITDVSVDLIYDLFEYAQAGKDKSCLSEHDLVRFKNDQLDLWVWSKLPITCWFVSVKVVREGQLIDRKQFKTIAIVEPVI